MQGTRTEINKPAILLTGGAGFLGQNIVKELLAPASPVGFSLLRIFDIHEFAVPADARVEFIKGDVRDAGALTAACIGIDVVIHSAAVVDWGTMPESEVHAINFGGTLNVVEACRSTGVRFLLYTSSIDAIYSGKTLAGVDESYPYPETYSNMYCRSKSLAEQLVRQANSESLVTAALRPSDIYGPGDPFHIGSLINMARGGFYVRLGDGTNLSQHVYVGNIAVAHLQMVREMLRGNTKVNGKVYFITDSAPSNFFRFFDAIVEASGYPIRPSNLWIPRPVAYAMGAVAEFSALLVRPFLKFNPKFSRFAVIYTCTDYTFTSENARQDFGFDPKYSNAEAFERTVGYYRA